MNLEDIYQNLYTLMEGGDTIEIRIHKGSQLESLYDGTYDSDDFELIEKSINGTEIKIYADYLKQLFERYIEAKRK